MLHLILFSVKKPIEQTTEKSTEVIFSAHLLPANPEWELAP